VKRTLVKSPPELWAELSDPVALARHLGDLGDVGNMRITRVHAEERVDWEADRISGTVLMKASGWGTKVTLRVSRELGEATSPIESEGESSVQAAPDSDDAASSAAVESPEPQPDPEPQSVEELLAEAPAEPRRGFFSRLFRRRSAAVAPVPAEAEPSSEAPVSAHEDQTPSDATEPPPELDQPSDEPSPDLSADLKAAEEVAAEEVTAVLTATLDRLGAAHHRPFSRS